MRKRATGKNANTVPQNPRTRATASGTQRHASQWKNAYVPDFFRTTKTGTTISSVALGTYLGDSDDATDAQYEEVIRAALSTGINAIDTAINYRCQRSERVVGRTLGDLIARGVIQRDAVIIGTKAGYVPLDGTAPTSREAYESYLRREYFETGVLRREDLVGGGHALTPGFLLDQLGRSLRNLGLDAVDFFYLHNPEQQLSVVTPKELAVRIRSAFEALESCVERGLIGAYGCATWNGLRLPAGSRGHLSLYELVDLAKDVAGGKHHFSVVQLPINLNMSEAVRISTQRDPRGRLVHVVDAAAELGVDLVVSAPLLQGRLTHDLPSELRELFPGATDAQGALAFARSIPSVVAVAVGMRQVAHFAENLATLRAS